MSGRNALNGAQVIVDYLIKEKVPYAFGLCGHGNIQFIDALYERSDDIKTISVHHESVAGFMADVYYRVSGQPIATFTSCGPGSANMPISLTDGLSRLGAVPRGHRQRADQPVQPRCLPGDVPPLPGGLSLHGEVLLQEGLSADARRDGAARRAASLEDHGDRPARPGGARRTVRRVHGVCGRGIAEPRRLERQYLQPLRRRSRGRGEGGRHAACGRRPGIFVGQGVRYGGASEELVQLAERLQIPVAASMSGLGAIDTKHPLAVGMVARGGHYQANHTTRQADVLLALGVRFDDRTSSSWIPGYSFTIPPTKLIHVDIDPEEIGRNYPVALGLDGRRAHLPAPGACRARPPPGRRQEARRA